MPVAQRGRSLVAELILAGKARQLKSSALLWIATILWTDIEMATSQPTREEQPSVERALEQIEGIEVEAEGDGDPLEGLGNQQIAKIYHQLSPEDRQLFRQFKAFHKLHYDLYGHDAPSYQLARGIIQKMFSGIPANDAEVIAKARAEILAAERIKELCKQLGLAVPTELQQLRPREETPEYPPPPPHLRFPSQQEKQRQEQLQATPQPGISEEDVKPDVKPPRCLATTYLGKPGLLRMIGAGDDDHIITKVVPGTDPMQDFDEDDPANVIVIEHETDESDVDDLSEVSMTSADAMSSGKLQGLLANLAAAQQKTAEAIDELAARTSEMSTEQVGDAAAAVVTELGHIKGLSDITKAFDKSEVALILAVEKRFGANRRTIIECSQGYKYRYPKGVPTKVQFTLSKPEREEEGQAATSTTKPN